MAEVFHEPPWAIPAECGTWSFICEEGGRHWLTQLGCGKHRVTRSLSSSVLSMKWYTGEGRIFASPVPGNVRREVPVVTFTLPPNWIQYFCLQTSWYFKALYSKDGTLNIYGLFGILWRSWTNTRFIFFGCLDLQICLKLHNL